MTISTCSFHRKLVDKVIPRRRVEATHSISTPDGSKRGLRVTDDDVTKLRIFVLDEFTWRPVALDQSKTFSHSNGRRSSESGRRWWRMVTSSAYFMIKDGSVTVCRVSTTTAKSRGPITLPCGTPLVTLIQEDWAVGV
jgi:hypothetical protein